MESIRISFNILAPIILMIASGGVLRKTNIIDDHSVRKMNAAAFSFFLPVMMFNSIYKSSFSILRLDLLLFVAAAITLAYGIGFLIVPVLEKDRAKKGVLIQGMIRSNFAVYGYAVASAFCNGEEEGLSALIGAVVLPLFGIYSTLALEVYDGCDRRIDPKKLGMNILKNPLVLGGVLGLLVLISGVRFPAVLERTMDTVASAATPVSLVALGGFLTKGIFKGRWRSILIGVTGKLVLMPLIFLAAAAALGFRGTALAICLAIFASPTATASFAMTQQMSGDDSLAAALIVASCIGSFGTVFIFISLFHGMGML